MTPLQGTIEETLSPVPCSAGREVLWQNWLLEVFEIHFHCVFRLDALPFPQLTMGGRDWGEDGATTDKKQAPGLPICSVCLLNPWTSFPPDFQEGGTQEENLSGLPSWAQPSLGHTPLAFGGVGIRQGMVRSWNQPPSLERSRTWTAEGVEIVEVRHTTLESSLGLSPVASAILSKNLLLAANHGRPLLLSMLVLYTLVPSKLSTPKYVD